MSLIMESWRGFIRENEERESPFESEYAGKIDGLIGIVDRTILRLKELNESLETFYSFENSEEFGTSKNYLNKFLGIPSEDPNKSADHPLYQNKDYRTTIQRINARIERYDQGIERLFDYLGVGSTENLRPREIEKIRKSLENQTQRAFRGIDLRPAYAKESDQEEIRRVKDPETREFHRYAYEPPSPLSWDRSRTRLNVPQVKFPRERHEYLGYQYPPVPDDYTVSKRPTRADIKKATSQPYRRMREQYKNSKFYFWARNTILRSGIGLRQRTKMILKAISLLESLLQILKDYIRSHNLFADWVGQQGQQGEEAIRNIAYKFPIDIAPKLDCQEKINYFEEIIKSYLNNPKVVGRPEDMLEEETYYKRPASLSSPYLSCLDKISIDKRAQKKTDKVMSQFDTGDQAEKDKAAQAQQRTDTEMSQFDDDEDAVTRNPR